MTVADVFDGEKSGQAKKEPHFDETKRERVVLRFSSRMAEYVKELVWFPWQTIEEGEESLMLAFYVADFREVVREILSFGADVEVVEPESLRKTVIDQLEKLNKLYGI